MLRIFVFLCLVQNSLCIDLKNNLRGSVDQSQRNLFTPLRTELHEIAHDFIAKFEQNLLTKGQRVSKNSILATADISFQNFIVTRKRVNDDCNGPGK